jgi:hypothetical protein
MSSHNRQDHSETRKTGVFLRLPYDWRRPTWNRFRSRLWNPTDPRIITPMAFGWGLTINVHALLQRGLRRKTVPRPCDASGVER